jgi:hypothetical protein
MDMPLSADGARLPTLALMISMALASAVAAADESITPAIQDVSSRRVSSRAIHAERVVAAQGIDRRHDDCEEHK